MDIKKVIKLSLPTLCIFYISSFSTVPRLRPYHEVFGNGDYYLDLYFDTNPMGPLASAEPLRKVRVDGYLVQGSDEQKITGHWIRLGGQTYYNFELPKGRFHGTLLAAHKGQCEPRLHFRIQREEGERRLASGVMKAGFCH